MRSSMVDIASHPVMETLGGIGVGVGICAGGYFVLSGEMTPGAFVAFLGALGSLYNPLKRISMVTNIIQQGIAGMQAVNAVLAMKPEVPESPTAVALPQIRKCLEFAEVDFAYDSDQLILRDISFEARPGDLVAIVGHSGAGKTTLVNLIPRFYDPTRGVIRIDGQDIREVTFRSLRGQMGIVTQETFLFDDTIANNISYGRGDVSVEQIQEAARRANADEFIEALPEKYQTRVGERGVRLSGGQKQRIAIARAILKDPPILILDEATSSLDAESERLVQDALDRVMEDRLTFVIAHRLSTVIRADQILVLEDGMIVERGTHSELMGRGGAYAKLYSIQFEAAAAGQQAAVS
jgi:subfamily B ATP-binding cassette protein MsbA